MRTKSVYLGLAVLVASAAPALADDKAAKAKAKAAYELGLKHYNLAEYPEAIKAWKESYSLSRRPLLLFNIGQAYRLSGDCKLAMTFYENYQREEPNPKNPEELDSALVLCTKPAATPPVKPPDTAVTTNSVKPPDPSVEKPGPTVGMTGDVGGETGSGSEPIDEPTSSGGGLRKIGIGVGAAGVVLTGVGVYFAMSSASKADELDGYTGEWGQAQMDLESSGKSAARNGWIFGGLGLAAIAAGGVMIAIGGPKAVETSTVAVVPTRGGAAFGWSMKF